MSAYGSVEKDTVVYWSMGLVYDPRGLPGVMTTRPRVAGVLQMVSELTLIVSRVRTGQLRRIR
jgi:hypothetical protein